MKPPSDVTVLSVIEPRELPPLPLLLLEALEEMVTPAIETSRLGLLVCEREEILAGWLPETRELGGDGLCIRVGLDVDVNCRVEAGGVV